MTDEDETQKAKTLAICYHIYTCFISIHALVHSPTLLHTGNIHDFRSDVLFQALRVIDLVLSSFEDDSVIETLEWARDTIGTRVLKTMHSSAGAPTTTATDTTPLTHTLEAWELSVSVWIRLSRTRPVESFRMMRSAFGPGSDAFKKAIDSKSTGQLQVT